MKRVLVDMSATLLHHGHVRLLKEARQHGYVIVALTTDEEVLRHKGYWPELTYEQRREILLALQDVDEVVPSPWLIDESFMEKHKADILFHAGPNANPVSSVLTVERTAGISSSDMRLKAVQSLVSERNSRKAFLTPGPGNLFAENLVGLVPAFTRGDEDYKSVSAFVLGKIRELTGHERIACLQGSATTAIEVATSSFIRGNVAVIRSGYYSERLLMMLERKRAALGLDSIVGIDYDAFVHNGACVEGAQWLLAVYTETADAMRLDMELLAQAAQRCGARLFVDATGSINLEDNHELADICVFSSCKGLGGLTGAAFITFKDFLLKEKRNPEAFMLDVETFLEGKVTAPVNTICSLSGIAGRFSELGTRVKQSKQLFMEMFAPYIKSKENQPNLCTLVNGLEFDYDGSPTNSQDNHNLIKELIIPYRPRSQKAGTTVVCHLLDQFPSARPIGSIYQNLNKQALKS